MSAISPKQSYLAKERMINSKCQRKKFQAKAGEVQTHEDVLQRLKNDKEDQKAPKRIKSKNCQIKI